MGRKRRSWWHRWMCPECPDPEPCPPCPECPEPEPCPECPEPIKDSISVYFSPNRGADEVIIGFIDRCNETVDISVYSMTHDGIRDAILRAHARDVKVRIITDYLQASNRYADDETFFKAGISIVRGIRSYQMHNKFVLGDAGNPDVSAMATGSFNWSKNATEKNNENFVVIRRQETIDEFQLEFNALWDKFQEYWVKQPADKQYTLED